MTKQLGDKLFYKEQEYEIANTYPLPQNLHSIAAELQQDSSTCLYRGYQGIWKIIENMLFLVDISSNEKLKNIIFYGNISKVFANWFSGELELPLGNILPTRAGKTLAEQYLFLEIKEGLLVNERIFNNNEEFERIKKYQEEQNKEPLIITINRGDW